MVNNWFIENLVKASLLAVMCVSVNLREGMGMTTQSSTQTFSKKEAEKNVSAKSDLLVQDITTKSGLSAWFVENRHVPVVSVSLCFENAGSKMDPAGMSGLCAFLTALMTEGCGNKNSLAFREFLFEKNIRLSVDQTKDAVFIRLKTVKENIGDAFNLVKEILLHTRFDEADVQRVRHQLLTNYQQSLYEIGGKLRSTLSSNLFKGHPYAKTTAEFLKETPAVTVGAMKTFMKANFCQDNLRIAVCGDISADALKMLLDETFVSLEPAQKADAIPDVHIQSLGETIVEPLEIPQTAMVFCQPGIRRTDPNFFAAYILVTILGDGEFESRLWNEVREKRGLTYGISTSVDWNAHNQMIIGQTSTKNQSAAEVMGLIREQWALLHDKGVTAEEVAFVKERLMGSYPLSFTSTDQIANILVQYQVDKLPIDYINKRNELIATVTVEQVNQVAKELLKPEQLTFVMVGKPVLPKIAASTAGKKTESGAHA